MKLSDKLIKLRKEKGWSQEFFAEELDVSRQAISRWENGTALPDAQNILRISKLFNVTADYLLNDDHEDEVIISTVETETEETETETEETKPLVRKKRASRWYVIPAICCVLLAACTIVIVKVVKSANDKANAVCSHPVLSSVKENEIAPTCTTEGSYDEVVYCAECEEEILRTTNSVAKIAHTMSSSVKENEISSTCTAEGSYDEVFYCAECDKEILRTTKSVAKIAHTMSSSVKKNQISPTCTANGSYDEVFYCAECDKEIFRTTKSVAKIAHTLSNSVKEAEISPTCTANGSYDEVVYCTKCRSEVLRTHRSTKMLAHQFQDRKCVVCNEDQPSEGLIYMSNGDGTCFVDARDCLDENVIIPAYSPKGDKVTQIKAYAFWGNRTVKSIRIPETVIDIGEGAFKDCINLESVNLPIKLKMIQSYTFDGCKSLKEITIPPRVYYIGEEAFADCIACQSIVIPASVTKIGKYAFRNFSGCDGTVTFEIYDGWRLYDDEGNWVDVVNFTNSMVTPTLNITFRYSEYSWKRV